LAFISTAEPPPRSDTLGAVAARDSRTRLVRRAAKADLSLPDALADRLTAYLDLLLRWNRKINLTGFADPDEAVDRLLIEPVLAARHVTGAGGRLLDIGSGGGSPAIPLYLALPDWDLVMVESKARKAAFLREAIRTLELKRALVETARFEELLARNGHGGTYSAISLRAVRVERSTLDVLAEFLSPDGLILLFRGSTGPAQIPAVEPLAWTGTYPLFDRLGSRLTVLRRVR
jgi:16S rRNA (guanine527-N7)-methyltransferase